MKNLFISLVFFFLSIVSSKSQSTDGAFDVAYDGHGNQYPLSSLSVGSGKTIGGAAQIQAVIVSTCSAGYFTLHFVQSSYFDGNTNAQNVMCQLFSDLSGFISSTFTNQIHIACGSGTILGTAEPFYLFPPNATNATQGIIHNQIQKSLITGVDAYTNVPLNSMYANGGSGFYSAFITAVNTPTLWSTSLGTTTLAANQYDLYSVMLHEVTHALGFISLITANGTSAFGTTNSFYSVYDKFLYNAAGNSLLAPLIPSCSVSSYSFQGAASDLAPGTCPGTVDISTCSLAAQYIGSVAHTTIYTPNCFENASSLSHFEDICSYGSGFSTTCTPSPTLGFNNLYYTMGNARYPGNCGLRRYLQEEERYVLCDIGYAVAGTYSLAGTAIKSYTAGQCSGTDVWGVNDGFLNGGFTYTTTGTSVSIPTTAIVSNDASGVDISCVEVLYNNGSYSISGGSITISSNANQGLVILQYYPKKGSVLGNVTYIFAYFFPGQCGTCDFVGNGGFESLGAGASCGASVGTGLGSQPGYSILDCWQNYQGTPDLFSRNCGAGGGQFDLGNNTYQMNPVTNSFNGPGNDRVVNLIYNPTGVELLKNKLSYPLVPGTTYQLTMLVRNYTGPAHSNVVVNSNGSPVVIAVASMQSFTTQGVPFPTGLNLLKDFTVSVVPGSAWAVVTDTFVFSSTITANHEAIVLGPDPIKTASLMGSNGAYIQFDNISILPYPVTTTFSIPNALSCGNTNFTNLAQFASTSTVNSYTFAGAGITFTNSQYHFNTTGTLQAGYYPIAFTYSTTCLNTIYETVLVTPPFNLSAFTNSYSIPCSQFGNTITLVVGSSTQNPVMGYTWQPVNLIGSQVVVSPSVNTIYSVTASNIFNCSESATLAIAVSTNCCNNPAIPAFTAQTVSGSPSFVGPMRFPNSFTVTGILFLNGEFLISPNVSITIASGAHLIVYGAHLYGCTAMWEGIKVLDGGIVTMQQYGGVDNLIEDAKKAVAISNYTSSTNPILNISNTTFNKNYISIDILDYPITNSSQSSAISLNSCIFTCRDFTFSAISWPQTSTSDLRSTWSGTNVLSPPYDLQYAPVIALKSPYTSQYSETAIRLENVGTTSGSTNPFTFNSIVLGNSSTASAFLLFDAHLNFVDSKNSNVKIYNSVFQNTQVRTVSGKSIIYPAVKNKCALQNTLLSLSGASTDLSCRFFDCHSAVSSRDAYNVEIKNAVFRSTLSKTDIPTATTYPRGQRGIEASGNRMNDYVIENNELSNIQDAILCQFAAASFTGDGFPTPTFMNYINDVSIKQNTVSATLSTSTTSTTTNLVRLGLWLSSTSNEYLWSTTGNGIEIRDNLFYRVNRGIGFTTINSVGLSSHQDGPRKIIAENNITLEEDDYSTIPPSQWGILFVYDKGGSPSSSSNSVNCLHTIEENTVTLLSTSSITNTNISLIQLTHDHGGSMHSPYVICNDISNAYRGFVFEAYNPVAYWRKNQMQSLARGMELAASGIIGQQGGIGAPTDNQWNGTWTGNFATYVSASTPSLSKLFINPSNGSSSIPTNGGNAGITQMYSWPGNTVTTTGSYSCGASYNQLAPPVPNAGSYDSDKHLYIARTLLFRYLYIHPDLMSGNTPLTDFYNEFVSTNIKLLADIEAELLENDLSTASSLLADLKDLNDIDQHYYDYYSLYLQYRSADFSGLSEEEMVLLESLCSLCPEEDGPCIYDARNLYLTVTGELYNGLIDCGGSGARPAFSPQTKTDIKNEWKIAAYPNPATDKITFISTSVHEFLNIKVFDLSGRCVLNAKVVINDRTGTLPLLLVNGVYTISVENGVDSPQFIKLIISK
jgi:hypothetical protein